MTLTSIGYGDIATSTHVGERYWGCVFMFLAGVLWASVIGSACGVLTNLDTHNRQFYQTIDDLNYMMEEKQLDHGMRRRLRTFFFNTKSLQRLGSYENLLSKMSPTLRAEVAYATSAHTVLSVSYFANCTDKFLSALCLRLESRVFAQGETFGDFRVLYMLKRGLVLMNGRVLSHGQVWGEDFILDDMNLIKFTKGVALTYVEVAVLERRALNEVVIKYPEEGQQLRKHKAHMAARRGILIEAKKRRHAQNIYIKTKLEEEGDLLRRLSGGDTQVRDFLWRKKTQAESEPCTRLMVKHIKQQIHVVIGQKSQLLRAVFFVLEELLNSFHHKVTKELMMVATGEMRDLATHHPLHHQTTKTITGTESQPRVHFASNLHNGGLNEEGKNGDINRREHELRSPPRLTRTMTMGQALEPTLLRELNSQQDLARPSGLIAKTKPGLRVPNPTQSRSTDEQSSNALSSIHMRSPITSHVMKSAGAGLESDMQHYNYGAPTKASQESFNEMAAVSRTTTNRLNRRSLSFDKKKT